MARTRCEYSFRPLSADGALLLKVLGVRRLGALQAVLGGTRVWIPKTGVALRCHYCGRRDDCIRAMHRKGITVKEIARRFGVSSKTAYRVL